LPSDSPHDPVARRDSLLGELDAYHARLIEAAERQDAETIDVLISDRQHIIDDLKAIAPEAPIPPETGTLIAEREAELQRVISSNLKDARDSMGQNARRGRAALRYRRSN